MSAEKNLVRKFLDDAGYSDDEISKGFEYADRKGWSTLDQLGQITLSRILFTDQQLSDGEIVGWEPVDWKEME